MIYDEEGIKIIEFGDGSTLIGNFETDKLVGLYFASGDKHSIGEECSTSKPGDKFTLFERGADTAIVFKNRESFDVFAGFVDDLRESFN